MDHAGSAIRTWPAIGLGIGHQGPRRNTSRGAPTVTRVSSSKHKVAVVVGRFQTPYLHDGHCELLNWADENYDHVIVFIGVAQSIGTRNNPMDYPTRKLMIEQLFPHFEVRCIPDFDSDKVWSQTLDALINDSVKGKVDLIGGRKNFFKSYYGRNRCIKAQIRTVIEGISSTEMRKKILANGPIGGSDFRSGVIYSAMTQYPRAFPTVDIAVTKGVEVLMGRRHAKDLLRFPGGFVDPTDCSLEVAAQRELHEECDVSIEGPLTYVDSFKVEDWRYKGTGDGIMTTLFQGSYTFGIPLGKDDLFITEWVKFFTVPPSKIVQSHRPLYARFREWAYQNGGLL